MKCRDISGDPVQYLSKSLQLISIVYPLGIASSKGKDPEEPHGLKIQQDRPQGYPQDL